MRIVMLGAPGSGKGTQAGQLSRRLRVPAISTGDMLRAAVAEGSELGRRVKGILDSGALVDDDTMARVIRQRLEENDAARGFILDGYPRTTGQAETLAQILSEQGRDLDGVISIQVPEEELVRRALSRRRSDDREDVIQHRLDVYRQETEPLTDHYRELGVLREVDGYRSIAAITDDILEILDHGGVPGAREEEE